MAEASYPPTLHFQLLSLSKLHVSEQVAMVVVPGSEGDFAPLPRHVPVVSQLREGEVRVYKGSSQQAKPDQVYHITGGFVEVTPTSCTVLADGAHELL